MKKIIALVLTVLVLTGSKSVWALPSTNLDEYVMFAFTDFLWKGRNTFGGDVLGGNIGVNALTTSNTPVMRIGDVNMSNGTQLVADSLRINDSGTVLYDMYVNQLFTNQVFTLNGIQSTFTAPLFSSVPTLFNSFSAGTQDIQVLSNQSLNLAPGTYGDIDLNDSSTLRLGPGVYTFSSLNLGKKVNLYTSPGTIIQLAGADDPNVLDFHMNDGSYVGSEDPNVESIALFRVLGDKMNFGHNSIFYGEVLAPYADVDLGGGMNLYGRFIVDEISGDPNNNVYYRHNVVPEPATMALFATGLAGAYLRKRKATKTV
jgi:hypothetical protein